MHVVITSTIVSVIQLKLYILISSFLYILRVSFTKSLLASELSLGGIIFFYTLFSGYSKTFKFLLQLGMVTMCFLEMWLRIPAIKEVSNLSFEIKAMLIKKVKQDFYSVLPVLFMMLCMFVFVYFRN